MSKKGKGYALSGQDVIDALKGKTRLLTYNELVDYSSIDQLLNPYGSAVILYLETKNSGHWISLIKHNNKIEFFDSYGVKPDGEFKYIENKKLNYLTKLPTLTKLLIDSPYQIEYNETQLQEDGDDVSTCGRWAILRIWLKDIPLDIFMDIFKRFKDPDSAVVKLTNKIFE